MKSDDQLRRIILPPNMRELHETARSKFITSLWVSSTKPKASQRAEAASAFNSNRNTLNDSPLCQPEFSLDLFRCCSFSLISIFLTSIFATLKPHADFWSKNAFSSSITTFETCVYLVIGIVSNATLILGCASVGIGTLFVFAALKERIFKNGSL